jgi:signal peptidase II
MFLSIFSHYPRLGYITAIILILADQASKWWILEKIMQPPRVITFNEYFNLVLTWNNGISFGLFNNDNKVNALVISLIAIVIIIFLIRLLSKSETKKLSIGLGMIIGGAIGNVIDRSIHGAVMDFLDVHINAYHWPAFNIADSGITVGALILVVDSLFSQRQN